MELALRDVAPRWQRYVLAVDAGIKITAGAYVDNLIGIGEGPNQALQIIEIFAAEILAKRGLELKPGSSEVCAPLGTELPANLRGFKHCTAMKAL